MVFQKDIKKSILIKVFQSYKTSKLRVKKSVAFFGFEATFFAILCKESLLIGKPGLDFWIGRCCLTSDPAKGINDL